MGKASRTKRERRELAQHHPVEVAEARRPFPVFWTTVVGLVVAGIAALVLTSPSDSERAATSAAAKVPSFADVAVDGAPLPVSVVNALEAGLLALAMNDGRRTHSVIDMTTTWAQFDAALAGRPAEAAA